MYRGFRLNLVKSRDIIIFGSLLTTFSKQVAYVVAAWSSAIIGLGLKPNHHGQVKVVQILDTHVTTCHCCTMINKNKVYVWSKNQKFIWCISSNGVWTLRLVLMLYNHWASFLILILIVIKNLLCLFVLFWCRTVFCWKW